MGKLQPAKISGFLLLVSCLNQKKPSAIPDQVTLGISRLNRRLDMATPSLLYVTLQVVAEIS